MVWVQPIKKNNSCIFTRPSVFIFILFSLASSYMSYIINKQSFCKYHERIAKQFYAIWLMTNFIIIYIAYYECFCLQNIESAYFFSVDWRQSTENSEIQTMCISLLKKKTMKNRNDFFFTPPTVIVYKIRRTVASIESFSI